MNARTERLAELGLHVLAILRADDGADHVDRLAAIVGYVESLQLGRANDDASETTDPYLVTE